MTIDVIRIAVTTMLATHANLLLGKDDKPATATATKEYRKNLVDETMAQAQTPDDVRRFARAFEEKANGKREGAKARAEHLTEVVKTLTEKADKMPKPEPKAKPEKKEKAPKAAKVGKGEPVEPADLTKTKDLILGYIREEQGLKAEELASQADVPVATAKKVVQQLIDAELVVSLGRGKGFMATVGASDLEASDPTANVEGDTGAA